MIPMLARAPGDEYRGRLKARRAALTSWQRVHFHLGNLRAVVFFVALGLGFISLTRQAFSAWWLLIPAAVIFWLGGRLQRSESEQAALARAVEFYDRALQRLEGRWAGTGADGARFMNDRHLYAQDLDLFGDASLFQLLCAARTGMGEETLAAWLLDPASPELVVDRQQAVAELAPRLNLREDLAVLGEDARTGVRPAALAAWGERRPALNLSTCRTVRWVAMVFLGAATLALLVYAGVSFGTFALPASTMTGLRIFFLSVGVGLLATTWRFLKRTEQVLGEAEQAARDLGLLAGVLYRLEREQFVSPLLARLRSELDTEGQPPSSRIGHLDKLMRLVDSRRNMMVRMIAPFVLWDLHLAYALERWRNVSGPAMRRWLDAVGEMEALSSLAGYSYEHPADVFPELRAESPSFSSAGLGHPLLPEDEVVRNDVSIGPLPRVLIVSGSNMSGKSTLLRTVGINAVLAQAGAPVRARSLRMSSLAVGASIRTLDSLSEGTSRFFAEITRLRAIIGKAESGVPVLFLIDEFLHGTNSHDRRIGAEAIVRGLVGRGAIGLVTTHDLALAQIVESLGPQGGNVHFQDELVNGEIRFDYKMWPGVVRKSNAIELMRSVGLEV
jgi:hypothetical protein